MRSQNPLMDSKAYYVPVSRVPHHYHKLGVWQDPPECCRQGIVDAV